MATTLEDKLNALTSERRDRIERGAKKRHEEYLTLRSLRAAKQQTQSELAKKLGVRQASIAKLEKRSDVMLSTLRNYVEAMGGTLQLLVQFPDAEPVSLRNLGDTEERENKKNPAA